MTPIDIVLEIERVNRELQDKLKQIQVIDQQIQQTNQKRNALIQEGVELQGQLKLLQRLDGQSKGEVPVAKAKNRGES